MNNPLVIFMHRMQYSTRYKYIKTLVQGNIFQRKKPNKHKNKQNQKHQQYFLKKNRRMINSCTELQAHYQRLLAAS